MANAFRENRIAVDRVEQKRSYYCGPACSQMFLGHYRIPCDQADAFDKIQQKDVEPTAFYSDPTGIAAFLNSTGAVTVTIDFFQTTDFQALLNRINYTIEFLQMPCLLLSQAGGHWVVVDATRVNVDPTGHTDFLGLYIQNPWFNEVPDYYVTVAELQESVILPDTFGTKWKGQLVILSDNSTVPLKNVSPVTSVLHGGGADSSPAGLALQNLELQGFDNIRPIAAGGGAPVLKTLEVTGLDGASDYLLVPLDGVNNKEFKDFIYAAIRKKDSQLLAVTTLGNALQIYSDEEMERDLKAKFPDKRIDIEPGFFWKSCFELRSRFNVVRKFKQDGVEKFLLPNGDVVDFLSDFTKGGH
jgi:hypothetical protein